MSVPKSVMKINNDGVQYVSSCDRAQYTITELTRAALRDVGKYVCKQFRQSYYSHFHKITGNTGKNTQYWVRRDKETPYLQVGIKPKAFYSCFQETGSRKTPKLALLLHSVTDNVAKIVQIESKYLSALEDEAKALSLINEDEYEGGADE